MDNSSDSNSKAAGAGAAPGEKTPGEKTPEPQVKRFNNGWTKELESLFAEWADKAAGLLPVADLRIEIEPIDEHRRQVLVQALTERGRGLLA